jgi:hypothetical protein
MIFEVHTRRMPSMAEVMQQGLERGLGLERSSPIAPLLLGKRTTAGADLAHEGALAAEQGRRCTAAELHALLKSHWSEVQA